MTKSSRGGTAIAVFLIALFLGTAGLKAWSPWNNDNELGAFAAPANAKPMALGDLGPGVCWPRDERPSGVKNPKAGFAESNGPTKAAEWFRNPPKDRKAEAEKQIANYDKHLNAYQDYYLVTEVVQDWKTMKPRDRVIAYISKMKAMQLKQQMQVQNTHCNNKQGKVTPFEENHVLPVKEWIFFVPGHEPGTKDPRPAFKAVCGNPLLPPGKGVPSKATPTTKPPTTPPTCKSSDCKTPPPCAPGACTTTTPPPGGKKPNEGSGPKGNAPEGSGRNEDPGPGAAKPYNPPPSKAYTPPAPPPAKPPVDSKPTQHIPPPPEPSLKPTGGAPNTGMPPPPNW